MCDMCLDPFVLKQVEWTDQEYLDIQLKEHTEKFKRAVEKCKGQIRKSHPEFSEERVASYCFGAITKVFKKSGISIFAEKGTEVPIGEGQLLVQFITQTDPIAQKLEIPMDSATLYTMLTDTLKLELWTRIDEEYFLLDCPDCLKNLDALLEGQDISLVDCNQNKAARPQSDFALSRGMEAKDKALPYKINGKLIPACIRNALARWNQVQGWSSSAKASALRKLRNALRKVGGKPSE